MKRPLTLIVLLAILTSFPGARADEPAPASSAAPDAAAADAAAADAAPPAPPWGKVDEMPAPAETRSPVPKKAEWDSAPYVALTRPSAGPCRHDRVREWIRIHCDLPGASAAFVAGVRTDVFLWESAEAAEVIFPMRRGDRRVIQFTSAGRSVGYDEFIPGASPVLIQEHWMDSEPGPTITAL